LKRGADAPLKHPHIIDPEQGELKRGEASLLYSSPSPFKERGIKGVRSPNILIEGGQEDRLLNNLILLKVTEWSFVDGF